MRLTVIGNSTRYLVPLGAGTSYLVEDDFTAENGGTRILLDCGNGTHMRLAERLGNDARLDAVVVSHFHMDNMLDLLPVLFALPEGAPVFIPVGVEPRFSDLLRSMGMDETWVERADLRSVSSGDVHTVGTFTLRFGPSRHGCPSVAVRLTARDRSLCYLSDTGPMDTLAEFARRADLLVAHTLLLDREAAGAAACTNLTAGEAARLATEAGVNRLALSHIPFYRQASLSLDEAAQHFQGETLLLEEFKTYAV